jgi:ABC-type antimicrobial peptide transport system permease subunit
VTRRKFEIGIRVALGARRDQVLQLMMKEVWLLGLAGVTSGLLLAAYLARFVQSQLYGVKARDPLVMVLAGAGIFLLFA